MSRHQQRGQVLPVWAMGIMAMLIVTMAVVRYSDMVRWQVRAQNAADAAAQAIVAVQTQQFNEMGMVLYAADVEEFRIRNILYALERTAMALESEAKTDDAAFYRGIARVLADARGRSMRASPPGDAPPDA